MPAKWQHAATWTVRALLVVYAIADLALSISGLYPDPYLPTWFTVPWDLALVLWAACVRRQPGGGLTVRGIRPALQFLIIVAAFLGALTNPRRLLPFAFLIPFLYWDGVRWAWASLASLVGRGGGDI